MGLKSHRERCRTCPSGQSACAFYFDLAADAGLKALYLDNEQHDGYFRDQCVWRPEISIEDTIDVVVRYDTGTTLSYSLNAFNAWEGYHICVQRHEGTSPSIRSSSRRVSRAPMRRKGRSRTMA